VKTDGHTRPLLALGLLLGCLAAEVAWASASAPPPLGWLGISIAEVTEDLAERLAVAFGPAAGTGVRVVDVLRDGPAERAGLAREDVIVRLDAQPIWDVRQLQRAIRSQPVDRRVILTLLRGSERMAVPVTIGTMPEAAQAQLAGERFGFIVRERPSPEGAAGVAAAPAGIAVAFVESNSAAARADLRPQDLLLEVNRQPVDTLESFARALQGVPGQLAVRVARRGAETPLSLFLELLPAR
jgi:S1-C subfamily serine protease